MSLRNSLPAAVTAVAMTAILASGPAAAETRIRVQSVIPTKADEVVMLNAFGEDVKALTNGEVVIEVLPAGAVVGVRETLDAVDKGLVEGGFAWTHYWSGKHPAAMLFGSPVAGAGTWRLRENSDNVVRERATQTFYVTVKSGASAVA